MHLNEIDVSRWKRFFFELGRLYCPALDIDVSTKVHRTMRQIDHHLLYHGFIRCGSTEEPESEHQKWKSVYHKTNHHRVSIAVQVVSKLPHSVDVDTSIESESDQVDYDEVQPENHVEIEQEWFLLFIELYQLVRSMSGQYSPSLIIAHILSMTYEQSTRSVWRVCKRATLNKKHDIYNRLRHKTVYAGHRVYRKLNRYDAVEYSMEDGSSIGVIDTIIAPTSKEFSNEKKFY